MDEIKQLEQETANEIINECHKAKIKGFKRDYEKALNNIVEIIRRDKYVSTSRRRKINQNRPQSKEAFGLGFEE